MLYHDCPAQLIYENKVIESFLKREARSKDAYSPRSYCLSLCIEQVMKCVVKNQEASDGFSLGCSATSILQTTSTRLLSLPPYKHAGHDRGPSIHSCYAGTQSHHGENQARMNHRLDASIILRLTVVEESQLVYLH